MPGVAAVSHSHAPLSSSQSVDSCHPKESAAAESIERLVNFNSVYRPCCPDSSILTGSCDGPPITVSKFADWLRCSSKDDLLST